MPALELLSTGVLTTVQDSGRFGYAALGVGRSGAADAVSFSLANRLLANEESAPALEVTLGGLRARVRGAVTVSVTGAPCPLTVDGRSAAMNTVLHLPDGAELALGVPTAGVRTYVALRGGVAVEPVLGSCSTDTLAGLGPAVCAPGTVLSTGSPPQEFPVTDTAPRVHAFPEELTLEVVPGPRDDWFRSTAMATLFDHAYEVTERSDRIGMRLAGPPLPRSRDEELPTEGMVTGALQVPPEGEPVLFLADHPVTGGYPVIAVTVASDVAYAAQARPGTRLRFRKGTA